MTFLLICVHPPQIELGKRSKKSTKEGSQETKKQKTTEKPETFCLPVVGDYIALKCEQYKDCLPQVGQLTNVNDTEIEFNWLNGT